MAVYGVVIALTVALYLFVTQMKYDKERIDKITITFFFLTYLFLLCSRDISIGVDTKHYVKTFELLSQVNWTSAFGLDNGEAGFVFLEKVIAFFGGTRLFISVVAIITVLPVMFLYKNEAEGSMICISFFLISLLFEMFFSGMRQGIAIGLAVPAYYMTKKRKIISFVLIVILACLFHKSAILIVLIYPIYHAKITRKWLWFIVPLFAAGMIYRAHLLDIIFQIAGDEYSYKYSYLTGSSGQIGLMILFILLAIYSYIMLDETRAGEEEIGLRNILMLAAFIHLFTPLNPTISRINYYFILFIPVAISRINKRCNERLYQIQKVASFIMPVFFIAYFFLMKSDSLNVFNYQFCF